VVKIKTVFGNNHINRSISQPGISRTCRSNFISCSPRHLHICCRTTRYQR